MQTYARQFAINLAVSEHPHPRVPLPSRERGLDPTPYTVLREHAWNYGERRAPAPPGEWESPRSRGELEEMVWGVKGERDRTPPATLRLGSG